MTDVPTINMFEFLLSLILLPNIIINREFVIDRFFYKNAVLSDSVSNPSPDDLWSYFWWTLDDGRNLDFFNTGQKLSCVVNFHLIGDKFPHLNFIIFMRTCICFQNGTNWQKNSSMEEKRLPLTFLSLFKLIWKGNETSNNED